MDSSRAFARAIPRLAGIFAIEPPRMRADLGILRRDRSGDEGPQPMHPPTPGSRPPLRRVLLAAWGSYVGTFFAALFFADPARISNENVKAIFGIMGVTFSVAAVSLPLWRRARQQLPIYEFLAYAISFNSIFVAMHFEHAFWQNEINGDLYLLWLLGSPFAGPVASLLAYVLRSNRESKRIAAEFRVEAPPVVGRVISTNEPADGGDVQR